MRESKEVDEMKTNRKKLKEGRAEEENVQNDDEVEVRLKCRDNLTQRREGRRRARESLHFLQNIDSRRIAKKIEEEWNNDYRNETIDLEPMWGRGRDGRCESAKKGERKIRQVKKEKKGEEIRNLSSMKLDGMMMMMT